MESFHERTGNCHTQDSLKSVRPLIIFMLSVIKLNKPRIDDFNSPDNHAYFVSFSKYFFFKKNSWNRLKQSRTNFLIFTI